MPLDGDSKGTGRGRVLLLPWEGLPLEEALLQQEVQPPQEGKNRTQERDLQLQSMDENAQYLKHVVEVSRSFPQLVVMFKFISCPFTLLFKDFVNVPDPVHSPV